MQYHAKKTGFTLIELLIALVIVGIISAISYPLYTDYMLKVRRDQAKADLTELASYMERLYSENKTYEDPTTNQRPALPFSQSPRTGTAAYSIIVSGNSSAFQLTAFPQGAQAKDVCGMLMLTQTGQGSSFKANTPVPAGGCW